jgi:hypothetical protein
MMSDNIPMFLLVDALKRVYAAQYKGARSQAKAIAEYDSARQGIAPERLQALGQAFGIDPRASGADLLRPQP